MKPCPKVASTGDLIPYLLANRSRIRDCVIIDCLALDRLLRERPCRLISSAELMVALDCLCQSYLSGKLRRLRLAGLVDYKAGPSAYPGYQFLRIGPVRL